MTSITTNGYLLERDAEAVRAGATRFNVSIDRCSATASSR
jgi:molybdenum cofactor biosynthesis enzyme MoaA